jgi:predicted PP-loop superfamily ATPase
LKKEVAKDGHPPAIIGVPIYPPIEYTYHLAHLYREAKEKKEEVVVVYEEEVEEEGKTGGGLFQRRRRRRWLYNRLNISRCYDDVRTTRLDMEIF